VDEGEVLSLFVCESVRGLGGHGSHELIQPCG
jgi:hypothetical protein